MPMPTAEELRSKWSDPAIKQAEAAKPKPFKQLSSGSEDKLSRVKICFACQAQGIIKVQNGYRVMDVVCEKCGGDGCITTPPSSGTDSGSNACEGVGDAAIKPTSIAEKMAQVERLIEQADDLNDLEKLEAALRSGNIDAVLAS
mmetsp:Transcript_75520/g.125927  ORF Transcript_75520/g.125927 Transcript_75520/m.125927 type:complete len:144 (+) Transcript_75520:40-471(+)